jgi:hypothetical protein
VLSFLDLAFKPEICKVVASPLIKKSKSKVKPEGSAKK